MKNMSFLIALMVMVSGSVAANSFKNEEASNPNFIEGELPQVVKERNERPEANVGKDVSLILSKNSRLLKVSTNYQVRILSSQINWEYRMKIYTSLNRQLLIDANENLDSMDNLIE